MAGGEATHPVEHPAQPDPVGDATEACLGAAGVVIYSNSPPLSGRASRGTRIPLRGESERSRPRGGCRDAQRTPSAPTAPTNTPIGLFPVRLQRNERGAAGVDVEGKRRPATPADRRDLDPGGRGAERKNRWSRARDHRGHPALTQLAEQSG